MLKAIALFMLLALNSTSINNTLINNSSINDTLLNISSTNNTLLNNSTSEDDWFNKSSNLSLALPGNLFSDGTRIADAEQAGVKIPEEKPTTPNPIWDSYSPPEANNPDPWIDLGPLDMFLGSGESGTVCSEDGICYEQFVD
jgi:hypothetical protein